MANLSNSTPNVVFNGTNDADTLNNSTVANGVTIQGFNGNDYIDNQAQYVTIYAGDGNNTIQNGEFATRNDNGFYTYVVSGSGNDSITNHGRYSTIVAGAGNDYIRTDIYGSNGTSDYRNVTVFGGDGNDTLNVNDHETSLNGGAGDDIVSVQSSSLHWTSNTLQGGAGNDTIYGNNNSNVVFYNAGDGDDIGYGFANLDTIQIEPASAAVSSTSSGDNLILTINEGRSTEGHMTIVGGATYEIVIIYGSEAYVDLGLVDNSTGVFAVSTSTLADGEVIFDSNAAFKSAVDAGSTLVGNVTGDHVYVADNGDFRQKINATDDWNVTATDKNDNIVINGDNSTVKGADGKDHFSIESNVTVATIADLNIADDSLTFEKYITPGDLKANVENNQLVLSSNDLKLVLADQTNLTADLGNYTVQNGDQRNTLNELLTGIGSSDTTPNANTAGRVSLAFWKYGYDPINSTVSLNSLDEDHTPNDFATVLTDGSNTSLWGGAEGDDTLLGSDGYDEFFYLKGNGNDVVEDAGNGDVVNLLNINLEDISSLDVNANSISIGFNDGGSIKVNSSADVGFKLSDGQKWHAVERGSSNVHWEVR